MTVNVSVEVLPSLARTATVDSDAQVNSEGQGAHVIIDVTAESDTPSVVPKIQGYAPLSGQWYDLLVGASIVDVGTTVLKIHPGIVAVANVAARDVLPPIWRVRMEHADTDSITYSVEAAVMS